MTFTNEKLGTESADQILKRLRHDENAVALIGSGCSLWAPSNLPTGRDIAQTISKHILESRFAPQSKHDQNTIKKHLRAAALEYLLEQTKDRSALQEFFADRFRLTEPNPVHKAIATLLHCGILKGVITTNYDTGIETAWQNLYPGESLDVVVVPDTKKPLTNPVLFKIHGCASKSNTIVITLSKEGELDRGRRDQMHKMLQDKQLLVVGYSGMDFDICSQIVAARPSRVYWNELRSADNLSSNARLVLQRTGGINLVLEGDMTELWSSLLGHKLQARREAADKFETAFLEFLRGRSEWERNLFQTRVLQAIGCARFAEPAGKRLVSIAPPQERGEALTVWAMCLFQLGHYRRAAKTFAQAAADYAKRRDLIAEELHAYRKEANAWLAGGYYFRSWRLRRYVTSRIRDAPAKHRFKLRGHMALLEAQALERVYRLLLNVGAPIGLLRILKNNALRLLRLVARYAKGGHWHHFQSCRLWCERFDIDFSKVYNGPLDWFSVRDGFRQMGYAPAELMAERDLAERDFSNGRCSGDLLKRLRRALRTAINAGIHAEVLKIHSLFVFSFSHIRLSRHQHNRYETFLNACQANYCQSLESCEYSLLYHAMSLLMRRNLAKALKSRL